MSTAKTGDFVTINFIGKLKDSTEVLSTNESGPFHFVIGDDTIFEKISDAVVGMKIGDKKNLELSPGDAFGEYDQELLVKVPQKQLPKDLKEGQVLVNPDDQKQQWTVKEVKANHALLDGNHPLAGETILFELELVSIDENTEGPTFH